MEIKVCEWCGCYAPLESDHIWICPICFSKLRKEFINEQYLKEWQQNGELTE